MADPIKTIVESAGSPMPSQDDPGNLEWWVNYHDTEADRIASQPPGDTQAIRVGQLQGEMDHRAAAAGFRDEMAMWKTTGYEPPNQQSERGSDDDLDEKIWRESIVADTRDAFRDHQIPQEFAEYTVEVGKLDKLRDAGDREAFYHEIVETKSYLDALESTPEGLPEIYGRNDWRTAIDKAGVSWERKQQEIREVGPQSGSGRKSDVQDLRSQQPPSSGKARAGLQQARAHWALTSQQVREKYPLLQNDEEARKVMRAGARNGWLASQIPESWRSRLGIDTGKLYNQGMDRAYDKLVDKQANDLLKQRGKALESLRGVNPNLPAHLLPSKQYRAAENLVRIDQELRRLRPLSNEQIGAAVSSAKVDTAPERALENAPAQRREAAASVAVEKAVPAPAVSTKHDAALTAVRDLRAQVPVDGFRSKASEAMANRIVQQLQEGRETVQLSTRYAGGDQGQANATHRNAVETNAELIEAVRSRGIPVDTGAATVALGKKSEVELASQVEADHAMESLP